MTGAECPEVTLINALARWDTWVSLGKGVGYICAAAGLSFIFWGAIARVVQSLKFVIVWAALLISLGLMAQGFWPANISEIVPLSQGAAVLVGAITFAASVLGILWVHEVKGDDSTAIVTLFMFVWGAVAGWYTNQWVGALAVGAMMHLVGFKLGVGNLCYAFGFDTDDDLARGTATGIALTAAYVGLTVLAGEVPVWLYAYGPGVFYIASFVAYTGMLILSFGRFRENLNIAAQMWMVLLCVAGISAGMMLDIQPLAVMGGVFGFFFFLSKIAEVKTDSAMGVGMQFSTVAACILVAVYVLEQNKIDVIDMMTTLPA